MVQHAQALLERGQTSTEVKILDYLREHGETTISVLCRKQGIRPVQAAWTLVTLEEQGRIVSIPHGKARRFALARAKAGRRAA